MCLPTSGHAQKLDLPVDPTNIVVTATKTDTSPIASPQSVSSVSQREISLRGVQDLQGVLSYSAGIKFVDYPGGQGVTNFYLRGFRANAAGESLFRDGVRQQFNAIDGDIEPYGLERVDFLKGPASVLYGQGTPGGIVNAITKRPTTQAFGDLRVQTGSRDRIQGQIDLGTPLTADESLTGRVTGLVRDSGAQFRYGFDDRIYVAPALRWKNAASGTDITLLSQYLRTKVTGSEQSIPIEGTILPNPNGRLSTRLFLGDPSWNSLRTNSYAIGYILRQGITDAVTFDQVVRRSKSDTSFKYIAADDGTLIDDRLYGRSPIYREDHANQWNVDSRLTWRFTTGPVSHVLLGGVDYASSRRRNLRYIGTIESLDVYDPVYNVPFTVDEEPFFGSRDRVRQTGVYIQDQISLERLTLTLNGRHDWVKQSSFGLAPSFPFDDRQKDTALTGRAGLVYETASGLAPYVSYSTSFQPLSFTTFAGELFKPTRGKQIEGGVKFQPRGSRGLITASLYQLTQTNVATNDPDHPGFLIQQGEVRSRGFELEARSPIGERIEVAAAYAYTDAKITKATPDEDGVSAQGLRQVGVPRNTLSGWLDYRAVGPLQGLTFGGGVRYISPAFNVSNTIKTPSYALVDAAIHYKVGRYGLSVTATNLFDKTYYSPGFYTNSVFFGYKRQVLATLSYGW